MGIYGNPTDNKSISTDDGFYTGDLDSNNNPDGYGTFYWNNGDSYEGYWKNGKRHGKGKMTYANGNEEDGDWANDAFCSSPSRSSGSSSRSSSASHDWENDFTTTDFSFDLDDDYNTVEENDNSDWDDEPSTSSNDDFDWDDEPTTSSSDGAYDWTNDFETTGNFDIDEPISAPVGAPVSTSSNAQPNVPPTKAPPSAVAKKAPRPNVENSSKKCKENSFKND